MKNLRTYALAFALLSTTLTNTTETNSLSLKNIQATAVCGAKRAKSLLQNPAIQLHIMEATVAFASLVGAKMVASAAGANAITTGCHFLIGTLANHLFEKQVDHAAKSNKTTMEAMHQIKKIAAVATVGAAASGALLETSALLIATHSLNLANAIVNGV